MANLSLLIKTYFPKSKLASASAQVHDPFATASVLVVRHGVPRRRKHLVIY